jgi:hypothetical protein
MSGESGILFKKEFDRIGSYYYGYIEVLKITNLSTDNTVKGVKIGVVIIGDFWMKMK